MGKDCSNIVTMPFKKTKVKETPKEDVPVETSETVPTAHVISQDVATETPIEPAVLTSEQSSAPVMREPEPDNATPAESENTTPEVTYGSSTNVASESNPPIIINTAPTEERNAETIGGGGSTKLKKVFQVVLIAILVVVLAVGAYFLYSKLTSPSEPKATIPAAQTPPVEPPALPTDEAPAVIDLSKYPIKVLNGSGKSGVASKLKDTLTEEGFTVSGTGNADNSDYELTEIRTLPDVPEELVTKLTTLLGKTYELASKSAALKTGSTDSVEIIIGSTLTK